MVSYLRKQNIIISIYLDDIICIDNSYVSCYKNVHTISELLQSLGFVINKEKSCLTPQKYCKYLGFMLNSQDMTLSLPSQKADNIKSNILSLKSKKECKIREFAQLLGLLNSACPDVKYGLLYTKLLKRQKFLALQAHNDNYETSMKIPKDLYCDFDWWITKLSNSNNPIRQQNYSLELFTDASLSGWGAI